FRPLDPWVPCLCTHKHALLLFRIAHTITKPMLTPLKEKITLTHLRNARRDNTRLPILTCYDFCMARLMQEAGVPAILVGDSASNMILGHDTTLPVSLDFMIDITAAVRRGAPLALLIADMPFGSYQASSEQALLNTF